jgi:hypothetical protein
MKKYYFIILLLAIPSAAFAYSQEDCVNCHKEESKESVLQISMKEFVSSVHGKTIVCEDCHKGVKDKRHQTVKGSGAVNCNLCHTQENKHGINGKAEDRPECFSCHGLHDILGRNDKKSSIHPDELAKTCKACHPAESGETNYMSWFSSVRIKSHKKQDFSQNYKKDNCIGCHQGMASHGGKEPVTKENCYVCHMKMNGSQLTGYFHNGVKSANIANSSAIIFHIVITVIVLGFIACIVKALISKSKERRN